mmetsp:Transcript_89199/g.238203  ORF Transcript_89199/g.238203 Transcript_89199/m.238203 type:complete len:151 (-) Transcript_89199:517-969(-)
MSTKKDDESLTILKNLAILIFLFYLLQYIVCLILAASFDLWSYQPLGGQNGQFSVGVLPFWHYECGIQQVYFALFLYNTEFRSFSGQCSLNIMALHGNLPDRTYSCNLHRRSKHQTCVGLLNKPLHITFLYHMCCYWYCTDKLGLVSFAG